MEVFDLLSRIGQELGDRFNPPRESADAPFFILAEMQDSVLTI
jgi:hypothetical protein